jgi:hypothetical protein
MVIMVEFESWPPSCICRVIEPSPLWVFFASYFKISFFLYITALSYFPLQQSVLVNFFDKFLAVRLLANSILLHTYLSICLLIDLVYLYIYVPFWLLIYLKTDLYRQFSPSPPSSLKIKNVSLTCPVWLQLTAGVYYGLTGSSH